MNLKMTNKYRFRYLGNQCHPNKDLHIEEFYLWLNEIAMPTMTRTSFLKLEFAELSEDDISSFKLKFGDKWKPILIKNKE